MIHFYDRYIDFIEQQAHKDKIPSYREAIFDISDCKEAPLLKFPVEPDENGQAIDNRDNAENFANLIEICSKHKKFNALGLRLVNESYRLSFFDEEKSLYDIAKIFIVAEKFDEAFRHLLKMARFSELRWCCYMAYLCCIVDSGLSASTFARAALINLKAFDADDPNIDIELAKARKILIENMSRIISFSPRRNPTPDHNIDEKLKFRKLTPYDDGYREEDEAVLFSVLSENCGTLRYTKEEKLLPPNAEDADSDLKLKFAVFQNDERQLLVTTNLNGMSPSTHSGKRVHIELSMSLPLNWNLDPDCDDPYYNWPYRLLVSVASTYRFRKNVDGHNSLRLGVVFVQDDLNILHTAFSGFFLSMPFYDRSVYKTFVNLDGSFFIVFSLLPLYDEENRCMENPSHNLFSQIKAHSLTRGSAVMCRKNSFEIHQAPPPPPESDLVPFLDDSLNFNCLVDEEILSRHLPVMAAVKFEAATFVHSGWHFYAHREIKKFRDTDDFVLLPLRELCRHHPEIIPFARSISENDAKIAFTRATPQDELRRNPGTESRIF